MINFWGVVNNALFFFHLQFLEPILSEKLPTKTSGKHWKDFKKGPPSQKYQRKERRSVILKGGRSFMKSLLGCSPMHAVVQEKQEKSFM